MPNPYYNGIEMLILNNVITDVLAIVIHASGSVDLKYDRGITVEYCYD